MTPKISLITATVGAALVLGVPAAWGNHQYGDALYRAEPVTVRVSPDLVDRTVAAEQNRLSNMLDARERALGANLGNQTVSPLDARERSFGAKLEVQLSNGSYPDVIDRTVAAQGTTRAPVGDDRFRIDHSNVPVAVSVTSSGREIEWPQIGIGFGVGMILLMGLVLALKATHTRPFAH